MSDNPQISISTVRGNAIIVPSDENREVHIRIRWTLPEKTPQEPLALLLGVLQESPKAFLDHRDYQTELYRLGGAEISFSIGRMGARFTVTLAASCTTNRFMHSVVPVESKLVRVVKALIDRGPRLDPVSISLAKGKLLRTNADLSGGAVGLASLKLVGLFPDSDLLVSPAGNSSFLREVTAEQVDAVYRELLASPCVIAVKNLPQAALNALLKRFGSPLGEPRKARATSCNTDRDAPLYYYATTSTDVVHRCYRFAGPTGFDVHSRLLRMVLREVLSGSDSLLFNQIRERRGMTYAIDSSFDIGTDVLHVSFQTELHRADRAIRAVDEVLAAAPELVSDRMIEEAIIQIARSLKSSFNSWAEAQCRLQLSCLECGLPRDLASWQKALGEITPEAVRQALGAIRPLTGVVVTQSEEER